MAKPQYDGVVSAVRYKSDGQVDWVRAYLRRGPIFTDRIMLDRQELVDEIKSGKQFQVGTRKTLLGSEFDVSGAIKVVQKNGQELIVYGDTEGESDSLKGVPVL